MDALVAGFWGFVEGGSLLIGALVGIYAGASQRVISIVMAIGAGVLISSVTFELMDEAYKSGGFDAVTIGLLAGAGAILTMLTSTMMSEACEEGGRWSAS